MARTISIPQRAGSLSDPLLFETLARLVSAVNMALRLPAIQSADATASSTLVLSNPTVRVIGASPIRTIAPVDFAGPIYIIAPYGPVTLATGGNIGSAATIPQGRAGGLVMEPRTGIWWPLGLT
jgi:hypothetical protein